MKTTKFLFAFAMVIFSLSAVLALTPTGPDSVNIGAESTKVIPGSQMVNTTGGSITPVNLSVTVQNPRWKAFVGNVSGSITLMDSNAKSIYDWSLAAITGRIYASRTDGVLNWNNMDCADAGAINLENQNMHHNQPDSANDNIDATFSSQTHKQFYVGSKNIDANKCKSLNTNVDGAAQTDSFKEVLLNDGTNMVYTTILEEDVKGYNGESYDFQMIVPEDATPGYTGSSAYYLYVEIGN